MRERYLECGQLRYGFVPVTSSKDVQAIVGLDRQKQLLGCGTQSCSAELAGALSVDAPLFGSVAKAGSGSGAGPHSGFALGYVARSSEHAL